MKGIILAGGAGTRLYPLTMVTSKQLLPVYDKPMIYYPLSTLMLAGIRDILIVTTPEDRPRFVHLLGDGSALGVRFQYAVQPTPAGIAQAMLIGETFIGDDCVSLILGDNIFFGNGLTQDLTSAVKSAEKGYASIFAYFVNDPERYGIVEFDREKNVLSVEEKPKNPKSNFAITGLYFYPRGVSRLARRIRPSARGELEITDLNDLYLNERRLVGRLLGRGYSWIDAGTTDSLMDAAEFVRLTEKRQGIHFSVPEEIAFGNGWITEESLLAAAERYGNSPYGLHLKNVAKGKYYY